MIYDTLKIDIMVQEKYRFLWFFYILPLSLNKHFKFYKIINDCFNSTLLHSN